MNVIDELLAMAEENMNKIALGTLTVIIITAAMLGGGSCVQFWTYVFTPPTATPIANTSTTTPTPAATITTTPTAPPIVNASPTTTPRPTSTPRPSVRTPDTPIVEKISPLQTVDIERVKTPDMAIIPGLLGITDESYYGSPYAYHGDTWIMKLDIQNGKAPIDKIRMRTTIINDATSYVIYENTEAINVYMNPYEDIHKTIGFKIPDEAPYGLYKVRISINVYSPYTGDYSNEGASYIGGINII